MLAVLTTGSILGQSSSRIRRGPPLAGMTWQAARQSQSATRPRSAACAGTARRIAGCARFGIQAVAAEAGDVYQAAQQKYDEAGLWPPGCRSGGCSLVTKKAAKSEAAGRPLAARLSRSSAGNDLHPPAAFQRRDLKAYSSPNSGLESMAGSGPVRRHLRESSIQDCEHRPPLTDQADVAQRPLKIRGGRAEGAAEATVVVRWLRLVAAYTEQSDAPARLQAQLATLTTNVDHPESESTPTTDRAPGELAGLERARSSDDRPGVRLVATYRAPSDSASTGLPTLCIPFRY
jgi:hypothetical protein